MNEVLWLGFAVIDLIITLAVYRLFGKSGLFGLIVFNLLLCNIQVLKTVEIFGMTTTLGNILYAGVFLATDILGEFHGKQEAKKGVLLGFVTLLMATLYMQVALKFIPAHNDFAQPLLEGIFGFLPRLAFASMAAYLISQLHDVWAYHFWMRTTNGRALWLRNNASTLVSQLLDSTIFCLLAFWGEYPTEILIEITVTTYIFKSIVALMDTPFIYLAGRIRPQEAECTA
ncbi:queuosine precursor transporter [Desulfovibrio mangrovi]|uniref:queuosine precursor transporter n=1 Tax=Desulfovibrio mangrovi TaxID=2976983 RepID=UPI002246249B|nr:queuosine precursor transporter [Desulfovibrio mangrovi]UZP68416.1 queuosine precursor transporter [Desulfovibrio mangrovi]